MNPQMFCVAVKCLAVGVVIILKADPKSFTLKG